VSVLFPKSFNAFPTIAAVAAVSGLTTAVAGFWYYATPKFWAVGYMPTQPSTGFSHQIHAGKLGMDCRYCHTNVEKSPEANIPSVSTCYGCHAETRLAAWQTQRVGFVREAYAKNESIEWRRVHKVPDYVRNFPHHAHINAGVSCYSCHGNIARMAEVYQSQPLHMSWCLECHRNPEPNLVPKDMVYRLFEVEQRFADKGIAQTRLDEGKKFYEERHIAGPENCGACHY
jgi:hypothetical protein